jgi:hypothetical protein
MTADCPAWPQVVETVAMFAAVAFVVWLMFRR